MYAANLAVLSTLGIPDSKPGNAILVHLGVRRIQECEWCITSLLGVVAWRQGLESGASSKIVLKSDIRWQIRAGIQGARSLSIISLLESVLEHPVGAALGSLEAACCAVARTVYSIAEEEIDFGDDTSDIDAGEVSDTATLVRGGLKVWELVLCDLPAADGVVIVFVT